MMPILLQMSASSGRMWLETRIVLPMLRSSLSRPRISMRARGSRPLAGSSSSSTCGSCSNTPPTAQPRGMPPRQPRPQGAPLVAPTAHPPPPAPLLAPLCPLDAVRGGEEFEIFNHLHVVVDAEEVRHVAHEAANVLGAVVDRKPAHRRLAPGRVEQRGEDAHGGRLTGAVGADEPV